jgi:hypothetical protein
MAETNFSDGVTPIRSSWLNDVDKAVYQALAAGGAPPTTPNQVAVNIGAVQSVQVGTTTTSGPGSSASVVNTGTIQAPVLAFTLPQGTAGANGNASTLLVAGSWDTWIPGIGMYSGANGTGTPVTADNTAIGSWVGIYNGQVLNATGGTITYHSAGYLSKPSGAYLQSANSVPTTALPITACIYLSIDVLSGFPAVFGLGGGSSIHRAYMQAGGGGNPNFVFTDGTNFPNVTDTNYTVGTTGLSPMTFSFLGTNPVVYEGTNATQASVTYTATGSLTGTAGGVLHVGSDEIGGSNAGVYKIGAVSLYLSALSTGNSGQIAQMSTATNAAITGAPWLATPVAPPNTYAGQANSNINANPTLVTALNAAPGLYEGLLRDTSASSGDQSTAIQTQLTANHHIAFLEREQRTAQHLLFVDDGYVKGNHATILGSASYAALEEDWIIGISATVGGGVDTTADPIIENLFTDGSAVSGIRDGTSYGNGPPTKTMAGIWFGDLQSKPGSAANSVAHGRVLGGGARALTYGLRLTGFQYSRAMDGRYIFSDVGVLIESANGEGNVDFRCDNIILAQCLIGVAIVANNTQQGWQGPLANITIEGGKHNGQNAGSVCHYAAISPWWRDGVHLQSGSVVIRDTGTEFQLNNAAAPYSVGRTFYTKTFDSTINTGSYPLGGTTPAPNLDGRAFVQQNANSTWWMCFYVPSCAYYVEGTKVVYDKCRPADSAPSAVYRMGPHGTADIYDPGNAGQAFNQLVVADHPTGRARMFGTADGITGYAQNLDRWPDVFVYNISVFDFFLAGGQLPELEVYRVITGNQPSWHLSSLSSSHQDNVSEASATRSPGFPALLQVTGTGSATTFSVVTASEGIFNGRKVTQMVYSGTHLTTLGTCSQITTANNQPITPTFSVNAPANGKLVTIDSETFYVISGGGTTTPTLARAQQNTTPATHAAAATVKTVGAYLDSAATGQQITTNWLGGYASANDPGAAVDTSAFIFIHNTSGTGLWLNFEAFWSGNSAYSNGNATAYNYVGRVWVGAHQHARLSFGKGSYESDYKICWFFDAQQGAVTSYVSGQMLYQSAAGLDSAGHTRMMQRGEWVRNILQ